MLAMIPSSEAMAENIRRHCEGMAKEIARRVRDDPQTQMYSDGDPPVRVEHHALAVLLDWYLGDFIPNRADGPG